jgi:hypothetical protein
MNKLSEIPKQGIKIYVWDARIYKQMLDSGGHVFESLNTSQMGQAQCL